MNILVMSIFASFIIVFTLLIRKFAISKLPRNTFLVLWKIALIRLLVPFSVPSELSVYNIMKFFKAPYLKKDIALNYVGFRESFIANEVGNAVSSAWSPIKVLLILWLTGMVVMILFFAISYRKYYSEVRVALPIKDNELINKWRQEHKILRSIQFVVSDRITTPITYGIVHPKIVLPKELDLTNTIQAKHIFSHEMIHIRRFDTLWKVIAIAALCVHWFNPIVWILAIYINRDIEITCDEQVIKRLGEDMRSDYAISLTNMAEQVNNLASLHNGFSKNLTEERIVSIMKYKKASVFTSLLSFAVVIGSTAVFATTPSFANEIPFVAVGGYRQDVSVVINDSGTNGVYVLNSDIEDSEGIISQEITLTLENVDLIPIELSVPYEDIAPFSTLNNKARALSITVTNYAITFTGVSKPPSQAVVTTAYEGLSFKGTLNLVSSSYNSSTQVYTGYYSGTLYQV